METIIIKQMKKTLYLQPRVIVHSINPEELLQNVNTSNSLGEDAGNADAKYFDNDDDDFSDNIRED